MKALFVKDNNPLNSLPEEAEGCSLLEAFKNWLDKYPAGMTQG